MISEQGMNKKPPFNIMLIKNKNKISKAFLKYLVIELLSNNSINFT